MAYSIAKNYYIIGKSLFTKDEWLDIPKKFFDFSLEYIEACYLSGDIEEIMVLCDNTLKLASNNIEKAMVYELKAKILDHTGEKRDIVAEEIKKGLKLFDADLPSDPRDIDVEIGVGIEKYIVT